jgi:hypothetical protein
LGVVVSWTCTAAEEADRTREAEEAEEAAEAAEAAEADMGRGHRLDSDGGGLRVATRRIFVFIGPDARTSVAKAAGVS